jgi:Nuclease-related domain
MALYAEARLCHACFRETCPSDGQGLPLAVASPAKAGEQEVGGRGMMPSAGALVSIFGPLLEIGPRVLLVMACGLLALAAARMSGRAIRERRTGPFIAAWALGIVGVCAARIGLASLAFYGSPPMLQGLPDPLSRLEIWRFLWGNEVPIALAVGSGTLIALWLRRGREAGAPAASSREARSRRIGAAGEARVAGELKRIGVPALHNVVLWGAGWSVELDHVVRVPSGIVVLETKTLGGTIAGELDAPVWTQRTAGRVEVSRLVNPVLQNQAHVWALEGFLGDRRVPICGYVVSAGRARFAPEIADAVVRVRDLPWILSIFFAEPNPRVLDAAWRRLEREAAKSGARRAAHEAHARRRRKGFWCRRQA